MADRYEPKLSVRPLSERKPAASATGETDPLVELTRIVTGRSTFDPAPGAKNKTVPAAASPIRGDAGLATDLESELLNDLQASFSAVREAAVAAPAIAPSPAPVARAAPVASPPVPRPQAAPPPSADKMTRPPAPRPAAAPPAQTLADRPSFFRSGNGPTVDLNGLQMRPTATAAPPAAEAPAARPAAPRWPPQGEARAPDVEPPSRFAPPRAAAFQRAVEAEQQEPGLADEPPFGEDEAGDEEFALEDLSALPEYGDEGELPPFPEDELAGLSRRRTNRALILIAGVLVVALAGGLGYVMLSDGRSTSAPPIIAADATPTKVVPEPTATAAADAAKATDRVDTLDNSNKTNLVTPGETAIASVPAETESKNPISRVLLPAGPGYDGPIADDTATPAGDSSEPAQIGPKKVRTVVVRPDGTIVSSEATPADATRPAVDVTPAVEPAPVEPAAKAPAKVTGMDAVLDGKGGNIAVDTDPLSTGAKRVGPAAGTVPAADEPPATATSTPAVEPTAVAAAPAKLPAKPVKPVVVAAKAPMEITPTASAAAASPAASGGVLVQLSSQKSEDAARAAYQGLQRRYPGILGSYKPNIQRADLGDKGIYYRVRVGPFASGDAQRLCEDLKAAGGDCIIAR